MFSLMKAVEENLLRMQGNRRLTQGKTLTFFLFSSGGGGVGIYILSGVARNFQTLKHHLEFLKSNDRVLDEFCVQKYKRQK